MSKSTLLIVLYFLIAIAFAVGAFAGNVSNPQTLWFCAAIFGIVGAFRLYLSLQKRK